MTVVSAQNAILQNEIDFLYDFSWRIFVYHEHILGLHQWLHL